MEPEQATGPPDTPRAGDIRTAWASASPDGQKEWLLLDYAKVVRPTAVAVHETYNPGAVYQVSASSTYASLGGGAFAGGGTGPFVVR
ncbi:MAG: hypothetical protein HQ582_13790 [Planctomycetes bacterium]|nr:hypothetical protein [Planctomycetota bacterium]